MSRVEPHEGEDQVSNRMVADFRCLVVLLALSALVPGAQAQERAGTAAGDMHQVGEGLRGVRLDSSLGVIQPF